MISSFLASGVFQRGVHAEKNGSGWPTNTNIWILLLSGAVVIVLPDDVEVY